MTETKKRYAVGIDLGTSNSAVSYFDLLDVSSGTSFEEIFSFPIKRVAISQWADEDSRIEGELLPSVGWVPTKKQIRDGKFGAEAATQRYLVVGSFAREALSREPARVIESAKSWLCHGGVDREQPILPWHSDEITGSKRFSPVEMSSAVLKHIKKNWNEQFPEYLIEQQLVTITVPASFDEAAQHLTMEAAKQAGFGAVALLEEPQAAFYHFLGSLKGEIPCDGHYLVCDIGGGTSDFSLLEVTQSNQAVPQIRRVAVSDHLLIGGDNLDIAIAAKFEERIFGKENYASGLGRISGDRWANLIAQARAIKEKVLSEPERNRDTVYTASLLGEGSSLFANLKTGNLAHGEVLDLILEGFFPKCSKEEKVEVDSGLKEWGLPHPADLRISAHLASFLVDHLGEATISGVLFNGGTLIPEVLQDRLRSCLFNWFAAEPKILQGKELNFGVANGASYYGAFHYFDLTAIKAGYPRSLYVQLARQDDGTTQYLCVLPKGTDFSQMKGSQLVVNQKGLKLRVGEPVRFQLFYSNILASKPGEIISDEMLHPLPSLETLLAVDKGQVGFCEVYLEVSLGETGLFAMTIQGEGKYSDKKWALTLQVQEKGGENFTRESAEPFIEQSLVESKKVMSIARREIETFYGKKASVGSSSHNATGIAKIIEETAKLERKEWDGRFLRSVFDLLEPAKFRRSRSVQHEQAWLNLAGFCLRPGYGDPGDSFRVNKIWNIFQDGMFFPDELRVSNQWWIFWRRVAGGLTKDQQTKLFLKVFPKIKSNNQVPPEVYLMVGSFELLDMELKTRYVDAILPSLLERTKSGFQQKVWSLSRVASRIPLYGGPNNIVRARAVEPWIESLLNLPTDKGLDRALLQFFSQAARRIGDRELDIDERLRLRVLDKLVVSNAEHELVDVVKERSQLTEDQRNQLFGEELPSGLRLS